MINYNNNNELEIAGTGGELLAEFGIISVQLIKNMISVGVSKDYAINKFYEVLENTIKVYEQEGEL